MVKAFAGGWTVSRRRLLRAACVLAFSLQAWAQTNSNSPPVHTLPAPVANPLPAFKLKPGFRLELVAEAPQVEAPVAMAFDENGRLFVAEMRDYPNRREELPHLGRIRLLQALNTAGKFQTSTVFAEDLRCPSAVVCYDGGVFVAAAPEVLYLKASTNSADTLQRQTVFSGFGNSNAPNVDVFLNSFTWGLDNRIHGATAGLGGIITALNAGGSGPVSLAGSDFSFDPRTLSLRPEAGSAGSGLCFDSRGRKFLTDYTQPLRLPMYEPRFMARNPWAARPPVFINVLSPATPIFRLVTQAATKPVARTAPGTNQPEPVVAPSVLTLAPTWLTKACGTVIYRGSAFASNYLDNVFIAEPAAHVIHHAVLHDNGLEPVATRAPGEAGTEFLVSSDPSFHPMQIVNGPDGTLYVADYQNGAGSGRIFRIVPEPFKRAEVPQLGNASARELVVALSSLDGWRSESAARLLCQHPDPTAVPLLHNMLIHSKLPLARLNALRALHGMGALQEGFLREALLDADYRVREQAVQIAEIALRNSQLSEPFWEALAARAADPSICVRYQLAFALGETAYPGRIPALARLLSLDNDRWVRTAVFSSVAGNGAELLLTLLRDPQYSASPAHAAVLEQLATMVGVEGNELQVKSVMNFLEATELEPLPSFALLSALGEGLHRTRSSLGLVDPQGLLGRFYVQAQNLAGSGDTPEALRIQALRLLSVSPYGFDQLGDTLLLRLGSGDSPAMQSAVLTTLGRWDDPHVARALIARWAVIPAALRPQAATALLAWTNRVPEVLSALATGQIQREAFPPQALNLLRAYSEPSIRGRAQQLLGPIPVHHPEAVQRYQAALRLKGLPSRGREVFRARCAECHAFGGAGGLLDLTPARLAGKEKLLRDILEPNASLRPGYRTVTAQTKAGELLLGWLLDENLRTCTFRQPNGTQAVWARENIEFSYPQAWSLMPDNLLQGLSTQDVADLLDYLMTGP